MVEALELVVHEAFVVAERGIAVTFEPRAPALAAGTRVRVRFSRADGSTGSATGSVELLLRRAEGERIAVLLQGGNSADFTPGTVLAVEPCR